MADRLDIATDKHCKGLWEELSQLMQQAGQQAGQQADEPAGQ